MYEFIKSFHVLAVILWMGGMIFAPILASAMPASGTGLEARRELFKWFRRVVTPAMIAALGFGLWAAQSGDWFTDTWLQVKLVLVIATTGLHGVVAGRLRRATLQQEIDQSGLRHASLATAALLVLIVLLVVRKAIL